MQGKNATAEPGISPGYLFIFIGRLLFFFFFYFLGEWQLAWLRKWVVALLRGGKFFFIIIFGVFFS